MSYFEEMDALERRYDGMIPRELVREIEEKYRRIRENERNGKSGEEK